MCPSVCRSVFQSVSLSSAKFWDLNSYKHNSEAASPVRLARPWPDHFSATRWSRSQTAGWGTVWGWDDWARCPTQACLGPNAYVFLVILPALLPADQEPGAAWQDCIGTHVLLNTHAYTYDVQLLAIWRIPLLAVVLPSQYSPMRAPPPGACLRVIFYSQWPDHFWNAGPASVIDYSDKNIAKTKHVYLMETNAFLFSVFCLKFRHLHSKQLRYGDKQPYVNSVDRCSGWGLSLHRHAPDHGVYVVNVR